VQERDERDEDVGGDLHEALQRTAAEAERGFLVLPAAAGTLLAGTTLRRGWRGARDGFGVVAAVAGSAFAGVAFAGATLAETAGGARTVGAASAGAA
jgi:hypothetical protein